MTKKTLYSNRAKGRYNVAKNKRRKQEESETHGKYVKRVVELTVLVPIELHLRFKEISKNKKVPMSRLVVDKILNEVLSGDEFKSYGFEIPLTVDYPEDYEEVAGAIYDFIKSFKSKGIDIELAYYSMIDARVEDAENWVDGYRVLLDSGAITEFEAVNKYNLKKTDYKVRATDETGE